jgi:intracellular septation protein
MRASPKRSGGRDGGDYTGGNPYRYAVRSDKIRGRKRTPPMQQLIDLLPLIAFLVSYKLGGIYVATGVLIAACAVQIGWHWWRFRKVKTLHWVTAVLVLLFGSATLLFHDPQFIQWKPSVLMWLLGAAFLVSQFVGAKPLSRRFLESMVDSAGGGQIASVNESSWNRLNWAWVAFFALAGAANLYVARHFSESTWVYFKVGGLTVLTLLFVLPQLIWLMPKEMSPPKK